jgi:hypothetical protein
MEESKAFIVKSERTVTGCLIPPREQMTLETAPLGLSMSKQQVPGPATPCAALCWFIYILRMNAHSPCIGDEKQKNTTFQGQEE